MDNRQNGLVTVPPSPCGADLNLRAHAPLLSVLLPQAATKETVPKEVLSSMLLHLQHVVFLPIPQHP